MMILHVYNVSCVQRSTRLNWNETVIAMNTAEARDFVIKSHPHIGLIQRDEEVSPLDLVWHVHEITRFNV